MRGKRNVGWDGEEGEYLLRVLQETDAPQLLVGHRDHAIPVSLLPLLCGIDRLGLVASQQVADNFRPFSYEQPLTFPIFLQFQLADELNLAFADHFFPFCLQR